MVKESDLVLSIVDQDTSLDILSVHSGTLVTLNTVDDGLLFAPLAVSLLIAAMAIGFGHLRNPAGLKSKRVIITTDDPFIADTLVRFFGHLGAEVHTLVITPTPMTLNTLEGSDFIISCSKSSSEAQILRSLHGSGAVLLLASDPSSGVFAQMKRDPWIIKEMLTEVLTRHRTVIQPLLTQPVDLEEANLRVNQEHASLFSPEKAYVLVGGIGSLGLEIALWMYENGARTIVLTSRSGKATLARPDNLRALRIYRYLETLQDLKLTPAACDGSSEKEMASLLGSTSAPIAGCMLLSVVLNDRLFLSHTQATFEGSLAAKKGVFEAIEALLPIESLDFLIAFSSFSTFGNAGQTSYASGKTAVDWMLRKYPNAFSLVAPGILDSR